MTDAAVLELNRRALAELGPPEPARRRRGRRRTCSRSRGPWPRPRSLARDWFAQYLLDATDVRRRRDAGDGSGATTRTAPPRRRHVGRDPRPRPAAAHRRTTSTALVDRVGGRALPSASARPRTGPTSTTRGGRDLSRRLIEEHGFTWIGVEGDWPDCWRINRWVRGDGRPGRSTPAGLLAGFERWPTWMWANEEVAEFLGLAAGVERSAGPPGTGSASTGSTSTRSGTRCARSSAGSRRNAPDARAGGAAGLAVLRPLRRGSAPRTRGAPASCPSRARPTSSRC